MPNVFYFQYELRPLPKNEHWEEAGGCYANCYVLAQSAERAVQLARTAFSENHWEVVSLEEAPMVLNRNDIEESEVLDHYDTALEEGECYVYHLWPVEPQEYDAVH